MNGSNLGFMRVPLVLGNLGIRYLEGSYDRHLVREPLAVEDLTFRWGGWAPALSAPGLGVNIAGEALKRVTVRKEPLLR